MTDPRSEFGPLRQSAEAERETLYETLGGVLQRTLTRAFGLPPQDAESLVYETFIVYFGMDVPPHDFRAWLIAAACRSAKAHLVRRGLASGDDTTSQTRDAESFLLHREALDLLPARAREALRLRFAERRSYAEIAAELDVSVFAAERIVAKAAARLRSVMRSKQDQP